MATIPTVTLPDITIDELVDGRYVLPPIEAITDSPEVIAQKQRRVRELCKQRNAILLAHYYQRPEIQEAADVVADSLRLSQNAAKTDAEVIVMCGVHFMAETAAILSPEKKVLLPDLRAGCSLAASITAEELIEWKRKVPDAVVVSYINTSAAVKAESDYCCTSANAAKVVAHPARSADSISCRINFWRRLSRGKLSAATSSRIPVRATYINRFSRKM